MPTYPLKVGDKLDHENGRTYEVKRVDHVKRDVIGPQGTIIVKDAYYVTLMSTDVAEGQVFEDVIFLTLKA